MVPAMALNIWNHEDVPVFLRKFSGEDENLHRLLVLALRKPILNRWQSSEPLKQLPKDAPLWLTEAFNNGQQIHTFRPHRNIHMYKQIKHIADWMKAAIKRGEGWTNEAHPRRLMHFSSVEDAYKAADHAGAILRQKMILGMTAEEGTEVAMEFPDGWKIRKLLTDEAKDYDGYHLRHCVGDGAYDEVDIYSLRDNDGRPALTIHASTDRGYIYECLGYKNSFPQPGHVPYIKAFINEYQLERACETAQLGCAEHRGELYSIYDLPEGIRITELDLSHANGQIRLPENISITSLTLRATNLREGMALKDIEHNVILPKNHKITTIRFEQHRHGELHNADGPAEMHFFLGKLRTQVWRINGLMHRIDGPAHLTFRPNGLTDLNETGWYFKDRPIFKRVLPHKVEKAYHAWAEQMRNENLQGWEEYNRDNPSSGPVLSMG